MQITKQLPALEACTAAAAMAGARRTGITIPQVYRALQACLQMPATTAGEQKSHA